jgi:hypothetical protein
VSYGLSLNALGPETIKERWLLEEPPLSPPISLSLGG